MATSDEKPTTAVEAAVAPETADVSAEAQTTGTTSIVADIAAAASAVTSAAPTPGTATGTATPFELDEHQRRNSLNVTLADMCARGTALYAQKKYEDAAETFSRASEMQAEINGDMDPENAEILFLYGRAVFEVGKSKSDVLGDTPAPANEGAKKEKKADGAKEPTGGAEPEKIIGKAIAGASEETTQATTEDAGKKNPLLQFEGDEGYDDSDEEAEEEAADGDEEDDDDFTIAFQTLDLARVLFTKKLEAEQQKPDTEEDKGKEVAEEDSPAVKHIKERLADTHDLLAEISLESEKYTDAVKDMRSSLKYKQDLYPIESGIIAECHYKLSLALEFAAGTTDPNNYNQELRDEAVKEMQAAIDSTKAKLQAQEVELATMHSPEDNDVTKDHITEARDLIADMEQRLSELKQPPVDVKAQVAQELTRNELGGLFGAGGSAEEIEAAKKKATDLSGLVRKKAKEEPKVADRPAVTQANGQDSNGGKRKAEEPLEAETATESKKPKIDAQAS